MTMKHYVVVLDPVSKQNDFNKAQDNLRKEGDNAERMKELILSTMQNDNMADEVGNIEIPSPAPVLFVECTEKAIQKMLKMDGVQTAADDGRYTKNDKTIQRDDQPKRTTFLDLFKKRR